MQNTAAQTHPFSQSDRVRQRQIGFKADVKGHHADTLVHYPIRFLHIQNFTHHLILQIDTNPLGERKDITNQFLFQENRTVDKTLQGLINPIILVTATMK